MESLILMLQFFTRIPINYEVKIKDNSFSRGIAYFPIVGLVVGGLAALVFWGTSMLLPGSIAIVIAVLVNVLITGALHVDGLADTCDGIFSARSKDRMLEIMKDSRIGTNGTVAIFFDLVLKIALINQINTSFGFKKSIMVIISMTVVAKMMLSLLIYLSTGNSKGSGLGSLFLSKISHTAIFTSFGLGSIITFVALGKVSIFIILMNILLVLLYRSFILKRLDVITGDTMGALNEICEVFTLLVFVILERNLLL